MTIEEPATGILKTKGYDDAHCYHVECSCTDPDHAVQVWIEIDADKDIDQPQVVFYVKASYPGWKGFFGRLKDAMGILFGGDLVKDHGLLLDKQAAINFAAAINKSVEELDTTDSRTDKSST